VGTADIEAIVRSGSFQQALLEDAVVVYLIVNSFRVRCWRKWSR
jgi:hypothetical protein